MMPATVLPARTPFAREAALSAAPEAPLASTRGKMKARSAKSVPMIVWNMVDLREDEGEVGEGVWPRGGSYSGTMSGLTPQASCRQGMSHLPVEQRDPSCNHLRGCQLHAGRPALQITLPLFPLLPSTNSTTLCSRRSHVSNTALHFHKLSFTLLTPGRSSKQPGIVLALHRKRSGRISRCQRRV
jgi:hypothetical protein